MLRDVLHATIQLVAQLKLKTLKQKR